MKKTYIKFTLTFLFVLLFFNSLVFSLPTITGVSIEEILPGGAPGVRSHIAVDTRGQPHVFADILSNRGMRRWHRINGVWQHGYNSYPNQTAQWYNPHVEINTNNQLWVSGVRWWSEAMRVMVFNNVSVSPTLVTSFPTKGGYDGLPVGNVSINIYTNNVATVYGGNGGFYERYQLSGSIVSPVSKGSLNAGAGGEKNFYWVSRAPAYPHSITGTRRVEHACTDWSYNNSVRNDLGLNKVVWCDSGSYAIGNDGAYPMLVSDNVQPLTAYLAHGFIGGRVVLNIWKGTNFVRSSSNLILVDPAGSSGMRRFAVQMAPANKGGAWICYQSAGKIRVKYIPSTAVNPGDIGAIGSGQGIEFPGSLGSIAVGTNGNVHVTYINNGRKYRRITVTGD